MYAACGDLRDMGLPGPKILANLHTFSEGMVHNEHGKALDLLEEYDNLFSTGMHNFGLIKFTQH